LEIRELQKFTYVNIVTKSDIYQEIMGICPVACGARVTSGSRTLQKASTCSIQQSLIGTPETHAARAGAPSAIELHISSIRGRRILGQDESQNKRKHIPSNINRLRYRANQQRPAFRAAKNRVGLCPEQQFFPAARKAN
jgi:hypothetical protein